MAKKIQKFLKSFTLIELIIVIAIIAVLGVAAFLVLTQWMSKGRDAQRISDLSTIKTALDIGYVKNGQLPIPDDKNDLLYSGTQILYQGKFGQTVVNELGTMNKIPTDRTNGLYDYSLVNDEKTYMLRAIMENQVSGNNFLAQANAIDKTYKFIGKQLKGIVVLNKFIYLPSMFATGYVGNKIDMKDADPIFEGTKPGQELTGLVLENDNDIILSYLTGLGMSLSDANVILSQAKGISKQATNDEPELLSCDGTVHGQTKVFYKENNVVFGQSCDTHKKEFTCENGVWKDGTNNADLVTYQYFICTVGTASNCTATNNTQKSTTNLDIVFNVPGTEHGLGFDLDNTVNENNGVYKYTLQGTCNDGTFQNIILGTPELQSCNSGYVVNGNSCSEDSGWSGDATNGFIFKLLGQSLYPKNCNDLLLSASPSFKYGTSSPYNGSIFVDGVYWIKPDTNPAFKVYCDMSTDGGGWTVMGNWISYKTTTVSDFLAEAAFGVIGTSNTNWKITNSQITSLWDGAIGCSRRMVGYQGASIIKYYMNQTIGTTWPTSTKQIQVFSNSTCTTNFSNLNTCNGVITSGFGSCTYQGNRAYWGIKDSRTTQITGIDEGYYVQIQVK